MTTAIVGGGFLGMALAQALEQTIVASRSGVWRGPNKPARTRMHTLDITARPLCLGPLAQCSALVIAVAPGGDQDRRALYAEGSRALLEAARAEPWQRVIYVGSTSALPDHDGWIDERVHALPTSERGLVQRAAEATVQGQCERMAVPWTVLRLGGLYGPGREISGIYRRRREGPLAGDGLTPTNLIHRDDAVQAICKALAAPSSIGGVIHVCDDDHTSRRLMYARVAARLGVDPVRWAQPAVPGAPTRGKRVSNQYMKSILGVRLLHPQHVLLGP